MKLGFLSFNMLLGLLLIVLGLSAILRSFNIYIPLFRIVVAVILIYIGVSLLMGHRIMFEGDDNITLFRESTYSLETIENKEINVIFGKGVIDLSQIDLDRNKNFDLEVNSIFGSTDIYISDDTPVKITGSSAFASVTMPDNGNIVFGEINYNSNNDENIRFIKIEANAVFGSIEIIKKD